MPNGELKTNPITIPCVIEEDTTFVLEPSAIDITITEKLKDDVVLTEEQERDFQDQLLESKYGTTDVDSLTEE